MGVPFNLTGRNLFPDESERGLTLSAKFTNKNTGFTKRQFKKKVVYDKNM